MHSGARKTFQPPSPGYSDTWREHWTSRTNNVSPRQVSQAASPRQVLFYTEHLGTLSVHNVFVCTGQTFLHRWFTSHAWSWFSIKVSRPSIVNCNYESYSRLSFCVPVVIDILTGCLLCRALDNGINAFSDPAAMASFGMPRPPARRRSGRPSPTHGGNMLSQSATGWYHSGDCRCHSCHQLWPSKISWPIKE